MARGSNRQTKLSINLDGEQILLKRIEAVEALSQPFAIELDLIAELSEIDLHPHLGKVAAVAVYEDEALQRFFHGHIVESQFVGQSAEGWRYRLSLRPWTHFLSHNRDFAIYQDKTVPDIIRAVLDEAGISDFKIDLRGSYTKRTYCVQYGESDFAFISRLMEEEGIYYSFKHEERRHVMTLCDDRGMHATAAYPRLIFNPESLTVFNVGSDARSEGGSTQYLQSWIERVSTGWETMVTQRDFNFETPDSPIETIVNAAKPHRFDKAEVYEYPGGFSKASEATPSANVALQALRAERQVYRGQSQATGLACGTKFKLTQHPADRLNKEYLIVRTHHSITAENYRSGGSDEEQSYNVQIEAIPATTQWRPPRATPRPVVHGLESAIVTGPAGEEIFTDEYGRVKVRFHWDRSSNPGEKTTCWMRVSQTGGLGNIILPRVGHEVLVDFLGGDPDRPVVVGRVFNKSNMPVYKLPDNKTIALWRTKRYKEAGSYGKAKALDTGSPGANELRFEDRGGKEEVFLHAERDMKLRVRHKESHHIGLDQEIKVGNDRVEEVGNNEKIKIGVNQTEEVGAHRKIKIGGNDDLVVDGREIMKIGTTMLVEAKFKITLKVGQSSITIEPTGIKINAPMINIKASAMAEMKSPMTTVKGDGILTLKGGLTLIN
jgi:type VI secretion system secreted protein VgrG